MTKGKKTPRYRKPAQFIHEDHRKARVVKYLSEVAASERRQEALKEAIERENAKRFLSGALPEERVSSSSDPDFIGEGFIRLQEMIDEMDTELIGYTDVADNMRKALFEIADRPCFDIIWQRYFIGLAWSDVAKATGYSERQCHNLHKEAIGLLYDNMPTEYRQRKDYS